MSEDDAEVALIVGALAKEQAAKLADAVETNESTKLASSSASSAS